MPIAGDRPESGVRIAIERPRDEGPPWRYDGFVHTPDRSYGLGATVSEAGDVDVRIELDISLSEESLGSLAERVRLIVRTAWKQAKSDGEPPPRRIVRWRGEK